VRIDQNNFKKLAKALAWSFTEEDKAQHENISGKQEQKENLQQLKKSMKTGQDVKVSVISFFEQSFPLGPLLGSVLRRVLSVVYLLFAKLCSLLLEDHKSLVRNLLSLCLIRNKKSPFSQSRKARTRLKLLLSVTEILPEKGLQSWEQSTTQQRQKKNEKAKKGTPAVWTPVMVSHLFRDHQ